ncbi:hypothetical protein [Methylobacterium iners]|uniref:Uncharacterized protein n=1 Tax=Methylobacterium iners TaxID=418707 RepID=A0ABQ4RSN8_9HYPH|nr:hypothetical protein [Methylobacterium iners]GJD93370.1 hypothetical protein OCOJLMKI_0564 [Methylobacterium iners]
MSACLFALVALASGFAAAETPPRQMPTFGRSNFTGATVVYGPDGSIIDFTGPPASAAISVQKISGIGTTGALVSAPDTANRRTVMNTSASITCELMGSAAAYGTGWPLPPGGFFTFDASGRTSAALYVACASAGGTVAVMSY